MLKKFKTAQNRKIRPKINKKNSFLINRSSFQSQLGTNSLLLIIFPILTERKYSLPVEKY